MTTANDVIVHSLSITQQMIHRYASDLSAQEMLHRTTPKANCAAWIVGHLALSDRAALKRIGAPLPELPEGFEKRFSRDEGCPQADEFGDLAQVFPTFDANRTALIDVVKNAPQEKLDQPLEKPHPFFGTLGQLANFMAAHSAMHAGQITLIRRSLGRPPVV